MRNFKLFALLVATLSLLLGVSCEQFMGDDTVVNKPTISISDVEFDASTMMAKVIIEPSQNASAWYYKVEGAEASVEYTKIDGAFEDDVFFEVIYGVEYTISAYAENKAGMSDVATKLFCQMPEGELTIAIGEITLNEQTMKAEATIYPSSNATKWYWKGCDKSNESNTEWIAVDGNKEQKVLFAYEWGKEYVLSAYAVCGVVESKVVSKECYFEPSVPTITVSKPMFDEASMTVSFEVTPSEDTYKWYWGPKYDVTGEPQVPAEYYDNEARTVSYEVVYDVEYTFVFGAVNAINKGDKKEIEFSVISPCVDIAIENLTAYSLDAVITKKDHCAKYVAGAVHTETYNRNTFIEQAQASLNPDESYPFAVFNSATESRTFSEQDLVRNSLITSNENAGLMLVPGTSYTIAVYGENEEGMYTVTTKEFVAPEATLNGNVKVSLSVDNITETSATVNIEAESACKILAGCMDPAVTKADTDNPFDFEGKSNAEICNYLISMTHAIPSLYTEPVTQHLGNLAIGSTYYAYVIAIKDGKIGEVAFEKFTTKTPSLTGVAKITSAEIVEQTSHESVTVLLGTDSNATKVRLYAAPSNDHAAYKDDLEYIMDANTYQNYREEYNVVDGAATATVNIYHPGSNYYMYAVAVDKEGKAGEMVCIARMAGLDSDFYTTIEEIIEEINVDLTGTATVDLQITIKEQVDDRISLTVNTDTRSDNAVKVWLVRFNGKINEIEDNVRYSLSEYADTKRLLGSYKEAKVGYPLKYEDGGSDWDPKYEALQEYSAQWGGDILVAVTLDSDDKFRIHSYYAAGGSVVVL